MSTLEAALVVVAVLAFSLPAAYWQLRRAQRHEAARDRIIRESCELPVPAAADNEAGTDCAAADECALIFSLPAYDPALDAGCERLWDAIRDTNTTEGDQK